MLQLSVLVVGGEQQYSLIVSFVVEEGGSSGASILGVCSLLAGHIKGSSVGADVAILVLPTFLAFIGADAGRFHSMALAPLFRVNAD